jgi:hypothetical protein
VTRQLIDEREHQLRENDHRGDGIDEEIEELRGAPDDHADRDLSGMGSFVCITSGPRRRLCHRHNAISSLIFGQGPDCVTWLFVRFVGTATLDKLSNVQIAASQLPAGSKRENLLLRVAS